MQAAHSLIQKGTGIDWIKRTSGHMMMKITV